MDKLVAFLGIPTNPIIAGLSFIMVIGILLVVFITLMIAAFDKAGSPQYPRWDPRRWVAPSLEYYYALLIFVMDILWWGYVGFLTIFTGTILPLWFTIFSCVAAFLAFMLLRHFAQDKRKM